ncbi:MAG: NFACT family protein [Oscillospiraceae bacterium]|nr:NFACT family protein [Oscillospiraceae bacterium]
MAFDAYFLTAVLDEIRREATGARVEKIHQPSRDSVIFLLRTEKGRQKLLFAPNPAAPRLHLTTASPENPAEPPMFCMLLRKHLSGARLVKVEQIPMERCASFYFDTIDELGDPVQKRLVCELMGRTCNLYLLGPDGRIIDCLRRIGLDEGRRQALPGLYYQEPEPIAKEDPLGLSEEDYSRILAMPGADRLSDRLMDALGGLSPMVCREAALFAAGDCDARMEALSGSTAEKLWLFFREHLGHPKPYFTRGKDGVPKYFAFCPIRQYGDYEEAESFTALLDSFYILRDRNDAMRQKSQTVRKTVTNLCQRIKKKMAIQEKELAATLDRERHRQLGDIVTANIHAIRKGQKLLETEDFYDENMTVIQIPLSEVLSPQENAAKFYKDYTRMKNAQKELTKQLEIGREELSYLQSVLEELNRAATEQELEEIRQELQSGGYLKKDTVKKKMKQAKLQLQRYESTDGFGIYVGRNNRQNEELTFKLANKNDIWLHAQKVHGSHVIIASNGRPVPDDTITEAAQLAAYYSEASQGENVPVDVTPVKQIKKPAGGKPGMVIYHTYRTVYVDPKPDVVLPEY